MSNKFEKKLFNEKAHKKSAKKKSYENMLLGRKKSDNSKRNK